MKNLVFSHGVDGIFLCRNRPFPLNKLGSAAIWRLWFLLLAIVILLSGCATYLPQPLPEKSGQSDSLEILSVQVNKHLGKTNSHNINLADGLDLTEVAILAVFGNPELRAKRESLNVARAQAFAAGLLPDPQLAFNLDHPTGSTAGLVNALGIGIAYDIIPLITRQARIDAEQGTQNRVQLEILWQEWQVIQQARSLAVRYRIEQEQLVLLDNIRDLHEDRFQRSRQGAAEGNVTLDINGTDLSAFMDSLSQIYQLEQTHNQTRHDLSRLLGLQPKAKISIDKLPAETTYETSVVQAQLAKLSDVRPDLMALKAGYQAQESRVRAAILAQFPAFSIGISNARDTGNVRTNGFNIGLTIPLFSGNRGGIAIERASRQQLFFEYQARLAQVNVEVDRLLDLQDIVDSQQDKLAVYLPKLQSIVMRARKAYNRGDIDALTFLNMESTWINKQMEQLNVEKNQWDIKIALQTLLALPENNVVTEETSSSREKNMTINGTIFKSLTLMGAFLWVNAAAAQMIDAPSVAVKVANVEEKTMGENLMSFGVLDPDPDQILSLSLSKSGLINRVWVRLGQRIKRGDKLLEIITSPEARMQFLQAQTTVDFAARELHRSKTMMAEQLATKATLAVAEKTFRDAKSTLEALRKRGYDRANEILYASMDGIIIRLDVSQGQRVSADTIAMLIATENRLIVRLGVEPEDLRKIQPGFPVTITSVFVPEIKVASTIREIHAIINPNTHMVEVLAPIPDEWVDKLILGSRVIGHIHLPKKLTMVVPRSAVLSGDNSVSYLFKAQGGTAKYITVRTGMESDNFIEVTGALKKGDSVVISGNYELRDGMAIREIP